MSTEAAPVATPEQVGKFPTCDPPAAARWEYLTVPVVAAGFEDATGIEGYHEMLNEYGSQGGSWSG
ncbi:MAG TPA: hypothetical protein VM597_36210 [Gemmataceae bacterium]|nr:hypothetical protein [Gemmataceae bacterium]